MRWNVPSQRNPFFTGREDMLSQLYQALRAENAVALSHPQGISGLGGIGKTQAALEYAYRYRTEYDAVFWVRADSAIALFSGFVGLARLLEIPERDEKDQNIIVEAVLRWLRTNTRWLLVLDNIDDLKIAEPFLPKAGPGHILLTTRAQALSGIAERLEVQKMEPETGALLLLRRAGILPLQATLDMAIEDDRSVAHEISQELDGLPLALDQAGAYVKETPCPLPDYLARYQTRRSDILRVRGSFDQNYPASVATTWSLSFEKVSQANPAAPELLHFCAFLAPDAIPEELLTAGSAYLGTILAPVVTNPLQFDQVCKEVLRFSLFQREADERTLTIHRLVQAVLRDRMPPEVQRQWMQRAIPTVNAVFPEVEHATQTQCERLLPHALVCAALIEQEQFSSSEAVRLLNQTGEYLHYRGRYQKAELFYQQALAIWEKQLGPEHPQTAASLNNLAVLYDNEGKYALAEPLYQRVLAIWEKQLGPEDLLTAQCLYKLANLYRRQGRYPQAELLYQNALAIREKQLGPEHPDIAEVLHDFATCREAQDHAQEALSLYRHALAVREQKLGINHPKTIETYTCLIALLSATGQGEEVAQRKAAQSNRLTSEPEVSPG